MVSQPARARERRIAVAGAAVNTVPSGCGPWALDLRLLVPCSVLALLAAWPSEARAQAVGETVDLDEAVAVFWAAQSDEEFAQATDAILSTNSGIEAIWPALREGREYSGDVTRGRQLLSRQNRDGTEHAYVLHVPDDYDPDTSYPVRVYLHGGVMRPKPDDGRWWPNDDGLARPDAVVVFPASWEGSIWWQASQIENLADLLNDLKRVYNIDENRVSLLGISDGATGAYYHAFKATTPWANFLPFNGHPVVLGNPTSDVDGEMHVANLRNKPFFVINGALDRLYPADSVARYMRLFVEADVSVDFRAQPDAGHNMSWWARESPNIDAFIADRPRRPLPSRLTWETESAEQFNRAHWLVINELGSVDGESTLAEFNTIAPPSPLLGINMLGELQNGSGLRVFDVSPGSIAETSGMAANDTIVEIEGRTAPTVRGLKEALVGLAPGDRLIMKVTRNGEAFDLVLEYPAGLAGWGRPAFPRRLPSGRVELGQRCNTIIASAQGVRRFTLLLSPEQFDFTQPITVVTNGVPSFEGMVSPDVGALLRWAAIDQDRTMMFGAELAIGVTPAP